MNKSDAARLNGKKGGRPKKAGSTPEAGPLETHAAKPTEPEKPTETQPLGNPHGLSPRERLFVEAYCGVAQLNAAAAYELAGYKVSPASHRSASARLRAKVRVAEAIAARVNVKLKRLEIADDDECLRRTTCRARGDIRKVVDPKSHYAQLPDDVAAAVKSIRPTPHGDIIELYDAAHADETLLKVSGKLTHRHDVKVTRTLEDILGEVNALERAEVSA